MVGALAAVAFVVGVAVWGGASHEPAGTLDGSATPGDAVSAGADPVSPTSPPAAPETATDAADAGAGGPAGPAVELATGASASSTASDNVDAAGTPVSYAAGNMVDGDPETAWRTPGDGRGQSVTLTLPSAAHLTQVGLIPGYAKVDPSNRVDRFPENRRIRSVRWRFDDGTMSSSGLATVQACNGPRST